MSLNQFTKISRTKKSVRRAEVKETYSLHESIKILREPIKQAIKRGYSYEEISGMLVENGVNISASTLKQYLDPDLVAVKHKSTTANVTRQKSTSKVKQNKASQADTEDEMKQIIRTIDDSESTLFEIMQLSQKGGAFDFLDDEPNLYTLEDGDSVW
jgi:hypothetical protein